AEHDLDLITGHVGGDAPQQEIHRPPGAIVAGYARPSQLENLTRIFEDRGDVELRSRVERAAAGRHFAPDETISADHALPLAPVVIDHQKMVADGVEIVEIAP